jgi:hypothetical protein
LQEFPAKNVFERLTQQLGFGGKQRPAKGALPPRNQGGITVENG